MTINYKCNIGDKVLLKEIPMKYRSEYAWRDTFVPTEYEINGIGWELDSEGLHPFYRLYAYCDKWLVYHNRVEESMVEPIGTVHPYKEKFDLLDLNGEELKVGDVVIYNVARLFRGKKLINKEFTFSGEGPIQSFSWFKEGTKLIDGSYNTFGGGYITFEYERHFLCTRRDGSDFLDSRRYGTISYGAINSSCKRLPEDYIELYVKACIKERFNPTMIDEYNYHDKWLEHFGIYEDVKKLYNQLKEEGSSKKKEVSKKSSTKKDKLKNIVNQLSNEEREKLLKMLQN